MGGRGNSEAREDGKRTRGDGTKAHQHSLLWCRRGSSPTVGCPRIVCRDIAVNRVFQIGSRVETQAKEGAAADRRMGDVGVRAAGGAREVRTMDRPIRW